MIVGPAGTWSCPVLACLILLVGGCASTGPAQGGRGEKVGQLVETAVEKTKKGSGLAFEKAKEGGQVLVGGAGAAATKYREIKKVSDIAGEEEARLYGRKIAARVAGSFPGGILDAPALTRYVSIVGRLCAANAERQDVRYRFAILNSATFNAFAAPGGYVFITLGVLRGLRNEAELAGVLSHEIAHVDRRHVMKAMEVKFTIEAFVEAGAYGIETTTGDILHKDVKIPGKVIAKIQEMATHGFEIVINNAYSRTDELEADAQAVAIAHRAGYPADGLIAVFRRRSANHED